MPALGTSVRDAVDRRLELGRDLLPSRVSYLAQMLSIPLGPGDLDRPLTSKELDAARPSPFDPRSLHALDVAREGWTAREVLAHGVIDYHPTPVGPAEVLADHLQEWFEAGAADGFWLSFDSTIAISTCSPRRSVRFSSSGVSWKTSTAGRSCESTSTSHTGMASTAASWPAERPPEPDAARRDRRRLRDRVGPAIEENLRLSVIRPPQ